MLLKKIIKNLTIDIQKINIKGLSLDSRQIKKNYLFFVNKGIKYNGKDYIFSAIKKGAVAIVCEANCKIKNLQIPIIRVKNIKQTIIEACKVFYYAKPKNIIAITGTNGKSSVAEFYHQILSAQKIPVASIGTLGIKTNNKITATNLTTLDIISLHRVLVNIKSSGIDNVILEASSHGLEQGRLSGINFKTAIFTNFSQDHLDYHKNMKNYLSAKLILFSKLLGKKKYIITDSEIPEFLKLKKIAKKNNLNLVTIGKKKSTIQFKSIRPNNNFQNIIFSFKRKSYAVQIPLIGIFQIKNLFMSMLAAKVSGLDIKKTLNIVKKIKEVNGRLQLVKTTSNQTKIFIDYAHTPDALETALKTLKQHYKIKPIVVFGCGGERDKKKRSKMAKVCEDNAKKIYITDDNPRNENPKLIRQMIISGFSRKIIITEISSRVKAIETAITESKPNSIVLIAGKGHETKQIYGKKIINISDKEIVKNINKKKLKFDQKNYNKIFNANIIKKIVKKNKLGFEGVSINSKQIKKNNLFIAIKGKNHDGHVFAREALKNKANYCVMQKNINKINKNRLIKCSSTLSFLNKLALLKRNHSNSNVIAITGSSGKTTLKTLLGRILKEYGKTYFSQKSYNNHIGVPLSLCNLEHEHKYGVFEIGMSKAGEIRKLSSLIKPNIAIITNIGEAHLENFENLNGIAKAKSEIIENINKDGYLILSRDDKYFNYFLNLARKKKINVLSFGKSNKSNAKLIENKLVKNYNVLHFRVLNKNIYLKVKKANPLIISNILFTLLTLYALDLDLTKIINFSNYFQLVEGRGKVHTISRYKKKFQLIDESYNANPSSVKNAINNFSNIKRSSEKKFLLLGDMLELGKKSDNYHKNLAHIINHSDIDKLFVYGKNTFKTYQKTYKVKQGNILQNLSDFDEIFSDIINNDDYLMIKGSNATGLNKLSKIIISGRKYAL
jgi:murE/murF fusion protein